MPSGEQQIRLTCISCKARCVKYVSAERICKCGGGLSVAHPRHREAALESWELRQHRERAGAAEKMRARLAAWETERKRRRNRSVG